MQMVGHETESIYRRYAIVAEAELRAAGSKLEGITEDRSTEAKVVEFPK